jgi:hypothetical protein
VTALVASLYRSPVLAVLLGVVGFLVLAAELLYRPTTAAGLPTTDTVSVVVRDLGHGWGRMLSVALPADVTAALLVVPLSSCWLTAYTAVLVTRRTSAPFAPAGPLLAGFVLGLLITAGYEEARFGVTAVFLTAVTFLVLLRTRRAGVAPSPVTGPGANGYRGVGALSAVVVVSCSVAGATVLPFVASERFDPRSVDPPPVHVDETLNPLTTIKSQLRTAPAVKLFTVRISRGEQAVDRVRLAVLDRYDGTTWTSDSRFLVAGRALSQPAAQRRTQTVALDFTLDKRTSPFLPTTGQPVRLDGVGMGGGRVGFDEASGTLVTDAPLRRGLSYRLTSMVPRRDPGFAQARTAVTDAVQTGLPPGIPSELRDASARITNGARTAYDKLTAIETYLRRLPYSLDVPPGHSSRVLNRIVTGQEETDRSGYAEQHAAAFAVLARSQGLPTRISVGYRLRSGQDGTFPVTTADAHAWPEVHFAGYGWMSFDPTDLKPSTPDLREETVPPLAADQGRPPTAAPPLIDPLGKPKPAAGGGFGAILFSVVTAIAGLVILAVVAVIAGKLGRRHHRRAAATPDGRIDGAWREAVDRLVEHGLTPQPSATPQELAHHAAITVGRRSSTLGTLVPLIDSATFSRHPSNSDAAERAWQLERQLTTALNTGRLRRLRALADPRPLWSPLIISRARRRAARRLGVDQL